MEKNIREKNEFGVGIRVCKDVLEKKPKPNRSVVLERTSQRSEGLLFISVNIRSTKKNKKNSNLFSSFTLTLKDDEKLDRDTQGLL